MDRSAGPTSISHQRSCTVSVGTEATATPQTRVPAITIAVAILMRRTTAGTISPRLADRCDRRSADRSDDDGGGHTGVRARPRSASWPKRRSGAGARLRGSALTAAGPHRRGSERRPGPVQRSAELGTFGAVLAACAARSGMEAPSTHPNQRRQPQLAAQVRTGPSRSIPPVGNGVRRARSHTPRSSRANPPTPRHDL